ncbi:MAG: ATP-binding protein [Aureispira sp.]
MRFQEVIGHPAVKQRLAETYHAERTAHAQIFMAKPGNGALALALAYAQFLLCEQPQEQDSCGTCSACRKASRWVHPDLHFSYPTVGSKATSTQFIKEWRAALAENPYLNINQWLQHLGAENKQGNITKDECVSIVQRLSFKALEGRFKIMILWLPEFLGKEGNRLLKPIEEPRPNTVFLLVSEQPEKILNTILSRCQLVTIPRLEEEAIQLALEEKQQIPKERAQRLAQLSDGDYNHALRLVDEPEEHWANLFLYWLRVSYQGHPQGLVQWVEGIVSGKHPEKDFFIKMGRNEQVAFLHYALHFFKEFLSLQLGAGQLPVRLQGTERSTAQKMLSVLGWPQLQKLMELFNETAYHVERNGNPRILFLDLCIQAHHIMREPKTVL